RCVFQNVRNEDCNGVALLCRCSQGWFSLLNSWACRSSLARYREGPVTGSTKAAASRAPNPLRPWEVTHGNGGLRAGRLLISRRSAPPPEEHCCGIEPTTYRRQGNGNLAAAAGQDNSQKILGAYPTEPYIPPYGWNNSSLDAKRG